MKIWQMTVILIFKNHFTLGSKCFYSLTLSYFSILPRVNKKIGHSIPTSTAPNEFPDSLSLMLTIIKAGQWVNSINAFSNSTACLLVQ